MANVPMLYPLKTPENVWFLGVNSIETHGTKNLAFCILYACRFNALTVSAHIFYYAKTCIGQILGSYDTRKWEYSALIFRKNNVRKSTFALRKNEVFH